MKQLIKNIIKNINIQDFFKYFFCISVFLNLILISCSDFFKKEIEIDLADSSSKIVVSAGLENDLFYVYLSLSNPITTRETLPSKTVKDAVVKLYQDDILLLEIIEQDPYTDYELYYRDFYPYALRNNIKVIPGKSYRLEVALDGYPSVSSTVVAPEEPDIENISLDTSSVIKRESERIVSQANRYDGCTAFYQMNFDLNDNPFTKDYYLIEAFHTTMENPTISDLYSYNISERLLVTSTDRMLIQDNPDVVANQWMNDPEVNTFSFGQMILTDLTFQGKKQNLNILISSCNLEQIKTNECERLEELYGSTEVYSVQKRIIGVVKHICKESYDFYRTFVLQGREIKFINEPVNIISNINGGYGCFSVFSTKQFVVAEYDVCYVD